MCLLKVQPDSTTAMPHWWADEKLMRHVFALAGSLIVSVFIRKTTPLKTLFYLLVCALGGFDRIKTAEDKDNWFEKKTATSSRPHLSLPLCHSALMKLGQNVFYIMLPFPIIYQTLSVSAINTHQLFIQGHKDECLKKLWAVWVLSDGTEKPELSDKKIKLWYAFTLFKMLFHCYDIMILCSISCGLSQI